MTIEDLWRSTQETWQALPPGVQFVLRAAGVFAAAFVTASVAGWLVSRRLRAANFDALFRRSWSPPLTGGRSDTHPPIPTRLVTGLVRVTVWGGGVWALAYMYGWTDLARQLGWVAARVWALVAVILAALFLSRLVTEKLIEAVQSSPLRQMFEGWQLPAGVREPRVSGLAVVAGFLADMVVVLLALLVAADLAGLALAGEALAAAWQLVLHVFTAGIALLLGWVGARAVRAQSAPDTGPASSPAGFGFYAAASVMGGAALLAILLLAGNFPTYFGLVLLALVVMLVWPAQRWLPDIYAGVILRLQGVKEVRIDGGTYPVGSVGLVQTQLLHPEGLQARRNRDVLEAHLASSKAGTPPGPEASSPDGKPA